MTSITGERDRILSEYRRRETDGRQSLYAWHKQDSLFAHHRLLSVAGYTQLTDPTEAYIRWLESQGKEPLSCPPTFP